MENLKKWLLLNKKAITSLCFAVVTFFVFCCQSIIYIYNPISWILFIVLIIFFKNIKLYNKDFFKSSIIFAFVFSFFLTFGKIVYDNIANAQVSVWRLLFQVKSIFTFVGLVVLIYSLLINLLPVIYNFKIKGKKKVINPKKVFLLAFCIIILSWLPYFLSLYPGELSNDSIDELAIIINNFSHMTNHHPMIHVVFIFIPYKIGMGIFGSANMAVACSSILQMVILALIFSYFIYFIARRYANKLILVISTLYFAWLPMHGYYSVTMWKDVIFSGLMVLLVIQLIKICDLGDQLKFKDLISFIIISLLTIFFRNNAVYMFFVLMVFMIIILKKHYKILLLSFTVVLFIYYSVMGPLFNYLDIQKSASSEYIGMPLQQIARMAYKDVSFDKTEKKLLNDLIGGAENMKNNYIPQSSDGIKFSDDYNKDVFDSNKGDYLKLWIKLVIKHPTVALEAYSVSTLGYWYPGVSYWTVHKDVTPNKFNIYRDPKGSKIVQKYVNKIESRNIPIINMSWSTSLAFWIIAIFCYICIKRKKKRYILPYIPVFGIWLTMMLASPVYAEFRYIYSSYTCLPLLMILPYIEKSNHNKSR